MNDTSDTTVNVCGDYRNRWRSWAVTVAGILCGISFFVNLSQEPHFIDESAYVSQAYFGDLFFTGDVDSILWFEYPGYDLPPLTKYLVWSGLVAGGDARPGPAAMRAWYGDTSKRFETGSMLMHARLPVAICGMITVIAVGHLAFRWRGLIAALVSMFLLTIHPLFRTHARRAMADVPTEMGVTVALVLFLGTLFGSRRVWLRAAAAGIFTGLAASSKLNGLLAGMVIVAWAAMAEDRTRSLSIGYAALAALAGVIVFLGLNPFFYAEPQGLKGSNFAEFESMTFVERINYFRNHRESVLEKGQELFPDDALKTLPQKAAAMAIQGFGRFSPLGPRYDNSEVRFELSQDWPVIVWLPLVAAGAVLALRDCRNPEYKQGLFLLVWFSVAVIAIGAFLPLAWNRYYLPIVAPSIVLASGVVDALIRSCLTRIRARRGQTDV